MGEGEKEKGTGRAEDNTNSKIKTDTKASDMDHDSCPYCLFSSPNARELNKHLKDFAMKPTEQRGNHPGSVDPAFQLLAQQRGFRISVPVQDKNQDKNQGKKAEVISLPRIRQRSSSKMNKSQQRKQSRRSRDLARVQAALARLR
jgi:hypothetical protein